MSLVITDEILELEFFGHKYIAPAWYGFHDRIEPDSRDRFLAPYSGDVMLDIGGGVGAWAMPSSFLFKQVYSFEPDKETRESFRAVLRMNTQANIEIIPSLVSKYDAPLYNFNGWAVVEGEGTLASITIDAFKESLSIPKVDYIKIDVEGHELEVLDGARETLRRDKPIVMVEIHTFLGIEPSRVFEAMWKANHKYIATVKWIENYAHALFQVIP